MQVASILSKTTAGSWSSDRYKQSSTGVVYNDGIKLSYTNSPIQLAFDRVLRPTTFAMSYNITSFYKTIEVTLNSFRTYISDDVG